ncbi:MAG: DUF106 domain-containing protein [Halodesulfurarchaeum sp.]
MARTEEKVEDLVRENPEFEAALADLLGREGEIRWRDVKGDLTSGEWGRLLQKDILVEADSGFEFADPEGVRSALEGADGIEHESDADLDEEGTSWSVYDKAAAGISVAMFAGYSMQSVRNVIGGALDVVLGPLDNAMPFFAVIMVLAVVTGLYSSILQNELMDMDRMSAYQERMKEIQNRQKDARERGDDEELERIKEEQMDAMGDQMGMFKEQFRPMVWIMVLTIPVFLWMYWKIGARGGVSHGEFQAVVLPLVGERTWTEGIVGPLQTWILWYVLNSIGFSQIIRKSLNMQTTPG